MGQILHFVPTLFIGKGTWLYKMEEINIETAFITLSQLLKYINIFESGGIIKLYLQDEGVYVNDELEHRRGRKIYAEDVIRLKSGESYIVKVSS